MLSYTAQWNRRKILNHFWRSLGLWEAAQLLFFYLEKNMVLQFVYYFLKIHFAQLKTAKQEVTLKKLPMQILLSDTGLHLHLLHLHLPFLSSLTVSYKRNPQTTKTENPKKQHHIWPCLWIATLTQTGAFLHFPASKAKKNYIKKNNHWNSTAVPRGKMECFQGWCTKWGQVLLET